jgi:outer membrane protein assembly factor BamB
MKKGCLMFILSVIVLGIIGALYDDFRNYYEYEFPEIEPTLLKFKKDSFDLRKMLGDSFSISNRDFGQMRDGKLFLYRIKNVPNAERPHFDIPVFDVKAKKLLGIYDILAEPYKLRYPLIDFYKDTLYISSSDSFYEVLAIDTKTGTKSYITVDPCNQAPGAEQIIRTGSNLFILGKPYGIGIVNWDNKLCRETFPNASIEGGTIKLPVGDEINLFRTHLDKMNNAHYAVYDSKGKVLWKYHIPNSPKYSIRNTQESFCIAKEEKTLWFLDK